MLTCRHLQSCHLPFLCESRVMEAFERGVLEPLEANCICALASCFSDLQS